MNEKIKKLYGLVDRYIKKYRLYFKKIEIRRKKTNSFTYLVRVKNFCDHFPLQYRYKQFDFLKDKDKHERDTIILMYGIKTFIEFEEKINKEKINFPYNLYLTFYGDKESFFKKNTLLWPYINFCNDKKYLKTYDINTYILEKPKTNYSKYISTLLKENKISKYFTIFEYNYINAKIEDSIVCIDFRKNMNKSKINIIKLLKKTIIKKWENKNTGISITRLKILKKLKMKIELGKAPKGLGRISPPCPQKEKDQWSASEDIK